MSAKSAGAAAKPDVKTPGPGPSSPRLGRVLARIHPSYLPLIDKAALAGILDGVGGQDLSPPEELIFEWLRYGGVDDVVGVLSGQDPYPAGAVGLAFSKGREEKIPASFVNVAKGLVAQGRSRGFRHADVRPWALQGLLMPNIALTTRAGASNAHKQHWKGFVADLIGRIMAARGAKPLFFILWGADAAAGLEAVARRHGALVLKWGHPSPQCNNRAAPDKKFDKCSNFAEVDRFLGRPLVWDNAKPIVAFADGACAGNGKPAAKAGYGLAIVGGHFGATKLLGPVSPHEYAFRDAGRPELGFEETKAAAQPSNNRGELLAICWCLYLLLVGRAFGGVSILSDSEYSVKTLNEWQPSRRAKEKAAALAASKQSKDEKTSKKPKPSKKEKVVLNLDLIHIAEALLAAVRAQTSGCTLKWVRASHDVAPPADTASPMAKLIWKGNDVADGLAKRAKEGAPFTLKTPLHIPELRR